MPRPNTTSLNLLTRDGAICLTFHSILSPQQYDALYQSALDSWNSLALMKVAKELARQWDVALTIDPC